MLLADRTCRPLAHKVGSVRGRHRLHMESSVGKEVLAWIAPTLAYDAQHGRYGHRHSRHRQGTVQPPFAAEKSCRRKKKGGGGQCASARKAAAEGEKSRHRRVAPNAATEGGGGRSDFGALAPNPQPPARAEGGAAGGLSRDSVRRWTPPLTISSVGEREAHQLAPAAVACSRGTIIVRSS